jgi:hypothetical protein
MEDTTQEEQKKVVPFGRRQTNKDKEKKLNWTSSQEEEALYNRASNVIDAHSDNMIDVLANYMRENEVIDPDKLNVEEFKDMVLIKEAIKSLMFRVLGYEHELQFFVDTCMDIPLPTEEELKE